MSKPDDGGMIDPQILRQKPGGLMHCWSSDGVECLWCGKQRTPEEIAAWKEAGSPDEPCAAGVTRKP